MGEQTRTRAAHAWGSHFGTKRRDPHQIQECPAAVAPLTEKDWVKIMFEKTWLTSDSDIWTVWDLGGE